MICPQSLRHRKEFGERYKKMEIRRQKHRTKLAVDITLCAFSQVTLLMDSNCIIAFRAVSAIVQPAPKTDNNFHHNYNRIRTFCHRKHSYHNNSSVCTTTPKPNTLLCESLLLPKSLKRSHQTRHKLPFPHSTENPQRIWNLRF